MKKFFVILFVFFIANPSMATDQQSGIQMLLEVEKQKCHDGLQMLFASGVEDDAIDEDGNTPVHSLVIAGNTVAVDALLRYGKNIETLVNKADKHGITPLYSALWYGHKDIVRLLLRHKGAHTTDTYSRIISPLLDRAEWTHRSRRASSHSWSEGKCCCQ
ncbi:MAG: ankyrin repeat domain-containing protein [Deltaproteobacteria bacterium]|nr:ankyrin repeat domain-containing protein [Deltaproteobacteria bacterium]